MRCIKVFFSYFKVYRCFACIHAWVCTTCVPGVRRDQENSHQLPWELNGYRLPCGCWESSVGLLEDYSALLTAEPVLQPIFKKLLNVSGWFVCMFVCIPVEGIGPHFRQSWATMWVLEIELRSSARAMSAFDYWASTFFFFNFGTEDCIWRLPHSRQALHHWAISFAVILFTYFETKTHWIYQGDLELCSLSKHWAWHSLASLVQEALCMFCKRPKLLVTMI